MISKDCLLKTWTLNLCYCHLSFYASAAVLSVATDSTGTQRTKMWIFNLWPACALSNYLCPGYLHWSQLVESPEHFVHLSTRFTQIILPTVSQVRCEQSKAAMSILQRVRTAPCKSLYGSSPVADMYKHTMFCTNSLVFWDFCCQTWACFPCSWCSLNFFPCLLPSIILADRDEE